MSELTHEQQDQALALVATWLGPQMRDDGQPCPTGRDAAYVAAGPMLDRDYEPGFTPNPPRPTILLEGGPEEWAFYASDQLREQLAAIGVWSEPWACYALCLYSLDRS